MRIATAVALTLLAACGGTGAPKPVPTPEKPVQADPAGTFKPFATSDTVDALAFGMAPAIDSTQALRSALGTGNRTVHVPAGTYTIGHTSIPHDTILVLDPGVTLQDAGQLSPVERLLEIRSTNVQVIGHGARLVSAGYTSGEQRHGVFIFGGHNVKVEGLESDASGGDGFYVGGNAQDVELRGVLSDGSRRNGLSITSGIDVFVADSEFRNTHGTAPQFGIDIEPNGAKDPLIGITLLRVQTPANVKGGLAVFFSAYQDGPAAEILIQGHTGGSYSPLFVRPIDSVIYR